MIRVLRSLGASPRGIAHPSFEVYNERYISEDMIRNISIELLHTVLSHNFPFKMGQIIQTDGLQSVYEANAKTANTKEHEMTFKQAIKLYRKAIVWSALLSTALVMEGYDGKILGSLYAQPAFQKAYGNIQKNGAYQISAPWQAGLNNASGVGGIIGLYSAGFISERFGFRKTVIAGMIMVIGCIFIQFFSNSLTVLLVGQLLLGMFCFESCCKPLLTAV